MKIEEILSLVNKPGRYIGGEKNAWQKAWDKASTRVCCIFPDLYEIGMSHQGLLILYDLINRQTDLLADRCYCPDTDMEALMARHNLVLYGLETRMPLNEFDILAITLPYELCYTNIFTILKLAGIPFYAKKRIGSSQSWPLILGGGSCCLNPEPVAELFDAILIGDGEEAILEIARSVKSARASGASRQELLTQLSGIEGVYVPLFYEPLYDKKGAFLGMKNLEDGKARVKRRVLSDLSPRYQISRPLVPNIRIVHDRLGIEIARGCTRGCRYCQATTIYRPVRERSVEEILESALKGIEETGWEEVSLLSLSTGDYSAIGELIPKVMDQFVPMNCSVSLPSLRVGTLTPEIMDEIKRVRKTGITLAPEAGSERLRQAINKGITEEALLETVRQAFSRGWKNVKLYFMIGLPGETDEDIYELVELVKKVRAQARFVKNFKGSVQVTASIGTFVPKPQTPFQWEGQISVEESRRRLNIIKDGLRAKAYKVKWHDPRQSFLEGVFSRGDRRLCRLLEKAWSLGARLNAWTDNLKPELYHQAAKELGIELSAYLAPISEDAPLFWDHIDSGIKKAFLKLERKRALKGEYTPDCRYETCQGCGVCDFKTIKNVLKGKSDQKKKPAANHQTRPLSKEKAFFYQVQYSKLFEARFIGHLDMTRLFHRAIRRAKIPVAYSKGFHPMPKVAFDNPIPLGMESMLERFSLELKEHVAPNVLSERLQAQMTLGIEIKSVTVTSGKRQLLPPTKQTFLIVVPGLDEIKADRRLKDFWAAENFEIQIKRKKGLVGLDLKNKVVSFDFYNGDTRAEISKWMSKVQKEVSGDKKVGLKLTIDQSISPQIKPSEVVSSVLGLDENAVRLCRILKIQDEHS